MRGVNVSSGNIPVGKDNLAAETLLNGLFAFRMVHRERTYVGCHPRNILGFHATKSHGRADNGFLVAQRNISAGDIDIGENVSWVRGIRPELRLSVPRKRNLDPLGGNDGQHHGLGLGILVEVNRVGDDMGDMTHGDFAIPVGLDNLGAILLDDIRQLDSTARLFVSIVYK